MPTVRPKLAPGFARPKRLFGMVTLAFISAMSEGTMAANLGDDFIPDPAYTISGADTAGDIWLGVNSAGSTLDIEGGGSLTLDSGTSFFVGIDTSGNIATVSGTGNASQASLSVPNDVFVGLNDSSDNNSMTVGDWGNVSANRLVIGLNDNSSGNTFTASGANGTLQIAGDVYVGYSGDSNQAIINQGRDITVVGHVYLGVEASSSGNSLTVTGSGSSLVSSQEMIIGFAGNTNALNVQSGGTVTNRHTFMGYFSGADGNTATVSGTDSIWRTNGVFYLGFDSDNNQVTVNTNGQAIVGTGSGTPNAFAVTSDGALRISAGRTGTVVGNYLQYTGGTFHLDATSPSNYGQLAVTGPATLQDGARITVTVADCNNVPIGSILYSVISASSSLTRSGIRVSDNCDRIDFQAVQSGNAINLQAIAAFPSSVPTLGALGLMLLAGVLGFAGISLARRKTN